MIEERLLPFDEAWEAVDRDARKGFAVCVRQGRLCLDQVKLTDQGHLRFDIFHSVQQRALQPIQAVWSQMLVPRVGELLCRMAT
jgi:hypothetical protein